MILFRRIFLPDGYPNSFNPKVNFDIDMLQLSESENYEKIEELLAQYEDWISQLQKSQETIDKKYND